LIGAISFGTRERLGVLERLKSPVRVKSLRDRNPGLRFLLIDYANDSFEKSLPLENEQFAILKLQRRRARKFLGSTFSTIPPPLAFHSRQSGDRQPHAKARVGAQAANSSG